MCWWRLINPQKRCWSFQIWTKRTSSSSKMRHPAPEASALLVLSVRMKVDTSALPVWNAALEYQSETLFHSPAFVSEAFYTRAFQNKARCLNISPTQSSVNSLRCYAKLKPFSVTVTARLHSPPTAPHTAIIFVIGSSSRLPRPPSLLVLSLCWEGDGRHLLAHLFTLQTRPNLVAFPAVSQKQVIK